MPQLLAHHSTLHLERQFSDLDVDQSAHPSRMYRSEYKGLVPKIRGLMLLIGCLSFSQPIPTLGHASRPVACHRVRVRPVGAMLGQSLDAAAFLTA